MNGADSRLERTTYNYISCFQRLVISEMETESENMINRNSRVGIKIRSQTTNHI